MVSTRAGVTVRVVTLDFVAGLFEDDEVELDDDEAEDMVLSGSVDLDGEFSFN